MTVQQTLHAKINQTIIELITGDITQEDTDAIVNAANSSLLGGGGVDGAIHRAAGPDLLKETRELGGCETGNAKLTSGYKLKARYVIHAVGPIYRSNDSTIPVLLASAYHHSIEIAAKHEDIRSVAIPAISTGIYGYPMDEAAHIALKTICDFLLTDDSIELVRFVLYTENALDTFARVLSQMITLRDDLEAF